MIDKVICECCKKLFSFNKPDDIVEVRTMNEYDFEVAPRIWAFFCAKCQKKHAVCVEEEED